MTTKITGFKKLGRIKRKTLLYKSGVEYADYCINAVEGCSHGCRIPCYAMLMKKRFGSIDSYKEWTTPKIVSNALELLDKEIPKLKSKIKAVYLSFMTDSFMYQQPEVAELTLKIIEKLNENKIRSIILTKGLLPEALADKKKYGTNNEYGITLISLDEKFRKKYEPGSAPYEERIKALKYLSDQGLKTWVSIEPYFTPNIISQDLNKILESIKFVDRIVFGRANYNPTVTSYLKYNGDFYKNCVKTVKKHWQKINKNKPYIKKGTV